MAAESRQAGRQAAVGGPRGNACSPLRCLLLREEVTTLFMRPPQKARASHRQDRCTGMHYIASTALLLLLTRPLQLSAFR